MTYRVLTDTEHCARTEICCISVPIAALLDTWPITVIRYDLEENSRMLCYSEEEVKSQLRIVLQNSDIANKILLAQGK